MTIKLTRGWRFSAFGELVKWKSHYGVTRRRASQLHHAYSMRRQEIEQFQVEYQVALRALSQNFRDFIRAEDQIAGICPLCDQLIRLSEMELFYIPDRKDDVLQQLRIKERELKDHESEIRGDAAKRSRAALLGSLMEQVGPLLPGFEYDLNDLRALWDPIDFVAFHGIGVNRRVDSITFVDIKTGQARLSPVQKSIKEVVEAGNVHFETVERQAP
jgi:predicted Holliday junction resolvase-like endonuclease